MGQTILSFRHTFVFENQVNAEFKGRYGSITDNTVHNVQMDNTVQ